MMEMFALMIGITLGMLGGVCLLQLIVNPILPQVYFKYYLILLRDDNGSWEVQEEVGEFMYQGMKPILDPHEDICFAEICEFSNGFYTYRLDV